jgi:hypothetical protein
MVMGYIIIHIPVGVFPTVSAMDGWVIIITGIHIITHPGGDLPDIVTGTGMVIIMDITGVITGGIIMVITMASTPAVAPVTVLDTVMVIILPTARIFIKVVQAE